jgi:hypothetical protein
VSEVAADPRNLGTKLNGAAWEWTHILGYTGMDVALRGGCLCKAITYTIYVPSKEEIENPTPGIKRGKCMRIIVTAILVESQAVHYSRLWRRFLPRGLILWIARRV